MPDWREELKARLGERVAAERAEEIAQHLEAHHEELLASGMAEEAARAATLEELHGGRWDELGREARRVPEESESTARGWSGLGRDMRYAARRLRRSPGYAIAAILSLALGIGANAAIFQLLDAAVLQTLPVQNPQRLAQVEVITHGHYRSGKTKVYPAQMTYGLWERVEAEQKGFSSLGAWYEMSVSAGTGAARRSVPALLVSGGFFPTLGVTAARGRLIGARDDPPDCGGFHPAGVVLSYTFWQRAYSGAPVLGRMLAIEGHPLPIVGVSEAGFSGLDVGQSFAVALPLCAEPMVDGTPSLLSNPMGWWLAAIGRLKPGWTLQRASAQLAAIAPAAFAATLPPAYNARERANYLAYGFAATPAATGVSRLRREYEEPLSLLLGLAGLVLLIACANLANLMLARAGTRRRELAVRLALGASRGRLVRHLLAECVLLAALGAALGAAVGWSASRALTAFLSTADEPVFLHLSLDWRMLALLAGLATAACILFGLAPALKASRTAPAEALGASARGAAAGGRSGLRRGLTIAQVALALVLVVGALLFAATLRNLAAVNPGFQARGVAQGGADFTQVAPARLPVEKRELLEALQRVPGVRSAATTEIIPTSGFGWDEELKIAGAGTELHLVDFNAVSPEYFATLDIPLLAGRTFTSADTKAAPAVAIVSAAFARKFYAGSSPIGRTFQIAGARGALGTPYTIVGMVGDTKFQSLREPFAPIVYESAGQDTNGSLWVGLVVRSADAGLGAIAAEAGQAAAKIDPTITVTLSGFEQSIRDGLLRERLMSVLAECFAGLAVLLALIGLYGVVAYLVVQRRTEMGIRMALGAPGFKIVQQILGEAWWLLAIGLAVGAGPAYLAGRTARALLFGVSASDPRTLAAAIVGLAAAGTLAAFIPARRAARADPARTLREE